MFSWGETTRNGFGLMKVNDSLKHNADTGVSFTPTLNPPITRLSASNKVIAVLRKDGTVSIARIHESQEGKMITSRPKPVKIKSHIWSVSSGDVSVILLSRSGRVWCLDFNASVPKFLDHFHNRHVTQVACGDQHFIALTQDGLVFTWGKNTNGQLGLGYTERERPNIQSPEPLKALSGVPLAQITAGGDHSFALSLSGTVFGWGHNSAGQLGLGNTTDSYTPVPVVCLSLKKTISISCGQKHTAVLTKGGLVFTFGSGCYGQLGHNSLRDELKPRLVAELWGAEVTQIACGRNHTLALVGSSKKKIYSFGQGQKGQLGNGVKTDQSVPLPVNLSQDGKDDEVICHIFAGGNYSVALCSFDQKCGEISSSPISGIKTLDENTVEMWVSECDKPKSWERIQRDIKTTFSSPMCLNGSFLDRSLDKHYQTSPRYSGLDMSLARIAFEKLATKDKILNEIEVVVRDTLLPSLCKDPIGVESLRVFLIVPELLRVLVRQGHGTELTTAVAAAILSLKHHNLQLLEGLWSRIPDTFFRSAVKTFCTVTAKHLELIDDDDYDNHLGLLFSNLKVLQKMYNVNSKSPRSLPAKVFHIDAVNCVFLRLKELFEEYRAMEDARWFCPPSFHQENRLYEAKTFYKSAIKILVAYPCILDTTAKCGIWAYLEDLHREDYLFDDFENELLVVGRSTLLQDTFECLRKKSCYLNVPVKVKFKEENGIDEGGVSMEFFNLLGKELLNTEPAILQVNEYGLAWFSQDVDSVSDEFFLVGLLCGMALYNRCLLNLRFPLIIFKKLLGLDPSMDDMEEMAPTEAQSLQELLKYDEEIVEDLGLDFGWCRGRPLLPNGEMIPVTKVNRQEYVDLYIDMVFNKSVDGQFEPFQRGFLDGCPTHAWRMFLPDELMMLLHGDENFKWEELRENAKYEGYVSTDEVIQNFWAVFTEFSGEQKKSFLTFLTGAERLSRARLSRLHVTIKVLVTPDPDEHYPKAGTCYKTLQLPKYSSIHVLRQKLLHAITYCDVIGNN